MINPISAAINPSVRGAERADSSSSGNQPNLSMAENPVEAAGQGFIPGVGKTEQGKTEKNATKEKNNFDRFECKTCESRKYVDGSNDPGVSFKTPTAVSPEKASSAVRAHEQQHVTREQASARRENREVVSQSVTYHTAVCSECGRNYTSGGTTRTVTKNEIDKTYGLSTEEKGQNLNLTA